MANIRRNLLFRRLIARYDLEPASLGPAQMIEAVLPTIDADRVLRTPKVQRTASMDMQAGGVAYTVPTGQIWTLVWLFKEATTAGTYLKVKIGGQLVTVTANETASAQLALPPTFTINAGDTIEVNGSGNGGDTARQITVFYLEELLDI